MTRAAAGDSSVPSRRPQAVAAPQPAGEADADGVSLAGSYPDA